MAVASPWEEQIKKVAQAPSAPNATLATAVQNVQRSVTQPQGAYSTLSSLQKLASSSPYEFKAPDPFNYNPYADPAYQSALETARRNIAQQQADTNARLRASGQGKSSYSEQVANQIGAREMGRVTTDVLPQLINQAYQRYRDDVNTQLQLQQLNYRAAQDQIANLAQLYGLQNQRDQQSFHNRVTEAGLTGQYLPAGAQQLIQQILNLKQQAESGNVSPEQMANYRSQADQLRAQLALLGVDPNIVGYEADYAQAIRNLASGFPTMQARQQQYAQQADQRDFDYQVSRDQRRDLEADRAFEYQQIRDQIRDEQWRRQFDEDVRRYGIDSALQRQVQLGNLSVSQANAALARERFDYERDRETSARNLQSQVLAALNEFTDPEEAAAWLNANAGEITRTLGPEGFAQLQSMLPGFYGIDPNAARNEQQLIQRAAELAQRDPRATDVRNPVPVDQLIQEYVRLLQGR